MLHAHLGTFLLPKRHSDRRTLQLSQLLARLSVRWRTELGAKGIGAVVFAGERTDVGVRVYAPGTLRNGGAHGKQDSPAR